MNYADAILAVLALVRFLAELAGAARADGDRAEGRAEAFTRIAQEALNDLREIRARRDKAFADFDHAATTGGVPGDLQFRD